VSGTRDANWSAMRFAVPTLVLLVLSLAACHSGEGDITDAAAPDAGLGADVGPPVLTLAACTPSVAVHPSGFLDVRSRDAAGVDHTGPALTDTTATLMSVDGAELHFTAASGDFVLTVLVQGSAPAELARLHAGHELHLAFANGLVLTEGTTGAVALAIVDPNVMTGNNVDVTVGPLHFVQDEALCASTECGFGSGPGCGSGGCAVGVESRQVRVDGVDNPLVPGTTTTITTADASLDVTVVRSTSQLPPADVEAIAGVGGCLPFIFPRLWLVVAPTP